MSVSFSLLILLSDNISTLQHALLSYLQYKVQIHFYFSITPFKMKHLFTKSVPDIMPWRCTPGKAEVVVAAVVQRVLILLRIPKKPK